MEHILKVWGGEWIYIPSLRGWERIISGDIAFRRSLIHVLQHQGDHPWQSSIRKKTDPWFVSSSSAMKLMAQALVQIRESSCPNLSNRELVRCHHLEAADLGLHPRPDLHLSETRDSSSHQMEPCPERSMWLYLLLWKLEELQPTFSQRERGTKTLCFSSLEDSSVQFSQLCPTLCDPMDCSMPGLPVHQQLPEFTQTHVHWVGDAIHPSHPLSSSSPAFNLSQHQGLCKWGSSSYQVAKVLEFQLKPQSFQWIFLENIYL